MTVGTTSTVSSEPPMSDMSPREGSASRLNVRELALRYAMVGVLVLLVIVATVLYPGFLAGANIRDILVQNAAVGVIAVGMTFVIISGGFDLSVGAVYALSSVTFAGLTNATGNVLLAASAGIAVGIIAGLINGVLIAYFQINALIATLGSASVFSGFAYVVTNSQPFVVTNPDFKILAAAQVLGIPLPIVILVTVFVVGGLILSQTVYGRNIYSLGGNREASWLSGLRIRPIQASAYVLVGSLAGLAGLIDASRISVGQANVGANMALDAIAIVVVGGTVLMGGEGAVWRSAVGMLILATLTNVFYSLNVSQQWQLIAKGAIVIIAVGTDIWIRKRK